MLTKKLVQMSISGMHPYVIRMLGTNFRVHRIVTTDDIGPWGLAVPAIFVPTLCTCRVECHQPQIQHLRDERSDRRASGGTAK